MRVLVVDDERIVRVSTIRQLEDVGLEAEAVANAFAALERLQSEPFDVVLTDLRMPGMDGLDLLKEVRQRFPRVDVIVMTAHGSVETAVEAMQGGAADYLTKPFPFKELRARLQKLAELRAVRQELAQLRATVHGAMHRCGLVGTSPGIHQATERILLFAPHDAPVLVTGETGTGKEVVARALHREGDRSGGPFVAVSCASIPRDLAESELLGHEKGAFTGAAKLRRGCFERAHRGVLLLDDADDLPLETQAKLLRVLQEGTVVRVGGSAEIPIDVRIVVTTKVNLAQAVNHGAFRDDLFYRLRGLEIHLPPLRERGEDVLLLADHFLALAASDAQEKRRQEKKWIAPAAGDLLRRYRWPGNVRELRRAIEASAVLCAGSEIQPEHLPDYLRDQVASENTLFTLHLDRGEPIAFNETVRRFEEALIDWALRNSKGQQAKAAELLGLPRTTLQSKLTRRELEARPKE